MDKIKVGSIIAIGWDSENREVRVVTEIKNKQCWNVGAKRPHGFFRLRPNNKGFVKLLCE